MYISTIFGNPEWLQHVQPQIQLTCMLKRVPQVHETASRILCGFLRLFARDDGALKTFEDLLAPEYVDLDRHGRIRVMVKEGLAMSDPLIQEAISLLQEQYPSSEGCILHMTEKGAFRSMMGAFYAMTMNTEFLMACIQLEPVKTRFLDALRKLYHLPTSYTYDDFLHDSATDPELPDNVLAIFLASTGRVSLNVSSLNNKLNRDYVGTQPTPVIMKSTDIPCQEHDPMADHMMMGSEWYGIREGSFFDKISLRYGQEILAGTSGSACLLYTFVFYILELMPKTPENMVLLLAVTVAQYVPVYHTLLEVLMELADVLPGPAYTIDQNPVDYCWRLFRTYFDDFPPRPTTSGDGLQDNRL